MKQESVENVGEQKNLHMKQGRLKDTIIVGNGKVGEGHTSHGRQVCISGRTRSVVLVSSSSSYFPWKSISAGVELWNLLYAEGRVNYAPGSNRLNGK